MRKETPVQLITRQEFDLLLARKGLTVRSLAKRAQMDASNVSHILIRGTCRPHNAQRIAAALDLDITQIIAEETRP